MCGGNIDVTDGATVIECEYCGTKQTLPRLDSEKKAALYERAEHFRRNNEYDKAMSVYEQILNEDATDAESYWSLVLCRYGIEYVEDPSSLKRIPTVNRAQYTSIFADENYKSALQYADIYQKTVYEKEAKAIDEIQKGILSVSLKEEPFDIFICYKETDGSGRRTPDSVLATELYHELTKEGYKVFFSRITLEDKLGTAYEPYIFAALNSAKVMVVLGTKPEYFNAVWVRNEWSRYLSLIKNGAEKILIPAYRDMDPYFLPEEFSHLQAQDMSKLGFMQDLTRGIEKIIGKSSPKTPAAQTPEKSDTGANANENTDTSAGTNPEKNKKSPVGLLITVAAAAIAIFVVVFFLTNKNKNPVVMPQTDVASQMGVYTQTEPAETDAYTQTEPAAIYVFDVSGLTFGELQNKYGTPWFGNTIAGGVDVSFADLDGLMFAFDSDGCSSYYDSNNMLQYNMPADRKATYIYVDSPDYVFDNGLTINSTVREFMAAYNFNESDFWEDIHHTNELFGSNYLVRTNGKAFYIVNRVSNPDILPERIVISNKDDDIYDYSDY